LIDYLPDCSAQSRTRKLRSSGADRNGPSASAISAEIGRKDSKLHLADSIFGDSGYALDGDGDKLPGGNHELTFNYNAADINHDGAVNLLDFNVLSSNFGRAGATRADGDLNYDGRVNLSDFRMLAERFNAEIDGGGRVGGAFAPTQSSSISKAASRPSETLDLLA